jgi:thiol:disulfide interchange protein DsbD
MSVTYTAAGVLTGMLGGNLQSLLQNFWVIGAFSLILLALALSMFGFYELRLPLSWQNKLANITRSQAGGHYIGAAIMGCLSTLILSPCVTAPLIGVLGYIAKTGDIIFGSVALFSLGLGMGLPLLLIGTSAGKLLPKAGKWMNEVKSFFGVILLAVAINLMERILPSALVMALWASLLVFSGIYLGALTRSTTSLEKFNQGLGIISLAYGLLILIGASQGNTNPLQPLASTSSVYKNSNQTNITVVKSLTETKKAIDAANDKPVLVYFYADWCSSCKIIASTTLQDPDVRAVMDDFVFLKADVTVNNDQTKELMQYFNVIAPPTFLFFNEQGKEIEKLRSIGDVSADNFARKLKRVIKSN